MRASGITAALASNLVILISVGNVAGRFLWIWLSEAIGCKGIFVVMSLLQAVLFFLIRV